MSKDTGGPAFPGTYSARSDQGRGPVTEFHDKGLSLRDYFAAKALPVAWKAFEDGYFTNEGWDSINEGVAVCAYQMADAMIAARNA